MHDLSLVLILIVTSAHALNLIYHLASTDPSLCASSSCGTGHGSSVFVHLQASLLSALPRVDTETAQSLRRSTTPPPHNALLEGPHPPAALQPPQPGNPGQPDVTDRVDSAVDSERHSERGHASRSQHESPSGLPSSSTTAVVGGSATSSTDTSSNGPAALLDEPDGRVHVRRALGSSPRLAAQVATSSAPADHTALLSIPYTSKAQSLAGTPFSQASPSSRPCAHSSRVVCHASFSYSPASTTGRPAFACVSSGSSGLRNQARCRGRAAVRLGTARVGSHSPGLFAAACSGSGSVPLSSSWRLHATGSRGTTAETAGSEVASPPGGSLDAGTQDSEGEPSSDVPAAIEQAIDEAAILDRRSSHKQATSSSSVLDDHDISSSDEPSLLSTKHNESTLSLDPSTFPPSSPLPPPQSITQRSGQGRSDASALLAQGHNESTISLDLGDLPTPPELVQPPTRPRRPTPPPRDANSDPARFSNMPNTLEWDEQIEQPLRGRPTPRAQPGGSEGAATGSWDNLQPLFRPARPVYEPPEGPNEAVAEDLFFSALQSKRYKHEKGTSYKNATFALVPVDRQVCFLMGKVIAPHAGGAPGGAEGRADGSSCRGAQAGGLMVRQAGGVV